MVLRCHIDEWSPYRIAGWVDDEGPVDAIEIEVNHRRVAVVCATEYRKDLDDAGVGDGCRSFSFAISPYLVEPTNIVMITCGTLILHCDTLQPSNLAAPRRPPARLRYHIDECTPYRIAGWVDDNGPVDAIDIDVNRRRVAALSPTEYRKDLDEAGIGDGRRGFSFAISPHLVDRANVVTIRRGDVTLYSATLPPPEAGDIPATDPSTSLIEYLMSEGLREAEQNFFLDLWREHFDADWYLQSYPDVAASGMDAFEHFLRCGLKDGRRPSGAAPIRGSSTPVRDAAIDCVKPPAAGGEVALFATYSPKGRLKPHVRHYLDALKRHQIAVILIVNTSRPFRATTDLLDAVDGLFVRANQGIDFAAWAHVLLLHPDLFKSKILYLLNDSVLGPTNEVAFGKLLQRLRGSPADCIGLTQNYVWAWHYQSYFLALKRRALRSRVFRKFIHDIVSFTDKQDVINQYEFRLSWLLKSAGLALEVLFPVPHFGDPTVFDWRFLLQSGCPFLKVNTIRGDAFGVDTSDWREILAADGYEVALAEGTLAELAVADRVPEKQDLAAVDGGAGRGIASAAPRATLQVANGVRPKGGPPSHFDMLICGHDLSESGAPRAAFDVARVLRSAGHSVLFASPSDGPYRERLCDLGVEVIVDERLLATHPGTLHLARNCDKVFCNTIVCWPIVAQLHEVAPIYWYLHESDILHQTVSDAPALLPLLRGGATVLAPSRRSASALAIYGVEAPVIEYGIDEPAECRPSPRSDSRKVVIGVFGSYELRKGQDLAVAGMLSVPKELRDQAELRFFGRTLNPVFRANLECVAAGDPSIAFCGEVDHRECLTQMAACDVILSPSRDDPLPFVTLDALALGKALICSQSTGTSAYLEDGRSGVILRHNTPQEIGRALSAVIADDGLRSALGKQARALYKHTFSMRRFSARLCTALGIEKSRGNKLPAKKLRNAVAINGAKLHRNLSSLTGVAASMSATEHIFQAMRKSEMNDWVGGFDPAVVAHDSFAWMMSDLSLRPSDRVLDFGCGIGRTTVLLPEFLTAGELVGIDINPAEIRFCRAEISSRFPNASYYCTRARHPYYDQLVSDDEVAISEDEFLKEQAGSFDVVVASSVFTHFDPPMVAKYLNLLRQLTKKGGSLALSWFFDHRGNPPDKRLEKDEAFRSVDNLTYSIYSHRLFESLIEAAGLSLQRITYGGWRSPGNEVVKGQHLQDVTILSNGSWVSAPDPVV